jgi:hypothetical protein
VLQGAPQTAAFSSNQSAFHLFSPDIILPYCVQKWTGNRFEKADLVDIGVVIPLGHSSCLLPKEGASGFTVIHVNGLHHVRVVFCGCSQARSPHEQLLRRGLFPATTTQPRTCATFQVLRHFHIQSLQSKISTIHYFQGLDRETDNSGTVPKKVSFMKLMN